jgi:hypothetical protein
VIIIASFQFATIVIVKPDMSVDTVWTLSAKLPPTSRFTIKASVDNLVPIVPLKENKICSNVRAS